MLPNTEGAPSVKLEEWMLTYQSEYGRTGICKWGGFPRKASLNRRWCVETKLRSFKSRMTWDNTNNNSLKSMCETGTVSRVINENFRVKGNTKSIVREKERRISKSLVEKDGSIYKSKENTWIKWEKEEEESDRVWIGGIDWGDLWARGFYQGSVPHCVRIELHETNFSWDIWRKKRETKFSSTSEPCLLD